MKQYRLTDSELNEIMEASQPVRYMVIGGYEPESPRERAMRVWNKIAEKYNIDVDSIDDAGTGDSHDFKAEPK